MLTLARPTIVILNSRGGYIDPAMRIGRLVRHLKYETRVRNGAICNSACTLIWYAGAFRYLDRSTRLGLHSVFDDNYERLETSNAIVGNYLLKLDIPLHLINLQSKADPRSIIYVSHEQAKAWGLLNPRPDQQAAR